MSKILYIILISLFSLTVISCAKIDEGSVCLNINSKVRKVLQEKTTSCDRSESSSSADGLTGTYQLATNDYANGVATDSSGNVYVTGGTKGGLDGNTSAGNTDLFVVKYNSSGTKQWTKQLGSSSDDYANGIVTDSSGSVYISGTPYGGLDGNTSAGSADLFVVKYNSSGTKQ